MIEYVAGEVGKQTLRLVAVMVIIAFIVGILVGVAL